MSKFNSTKRFSNRAEDYAKYRPHYPKEIIDWLLQMHYLKPTDIVADVGAGTGISSSLFLKNGFKVIAVEPNKEMRDQAIRFLQNYPNFSCTSGSADDTFLPDDAVDVVVSAQAFHWFNEVTTRKEFERILKPGGMVLLIWNERLIDTDFERGYEQHILKHSTDYVEINHRQIDYEKIKSFFAPNACEMKVFASKQVMNYAQFSGRHLSSSYIPQVGQIGYESMITELRQLFDAYQVADEVTIHYDTKVYVSFIGV